MTSQTAPMRDTFAQLPGRVLGGATGELTGDRRRRVAEDLDLLTWLGLRAYRFSICWPRWQPDGRGRPCPREVDFYDRLVDGLLARGIQPWVTLHHCDLPQPLQDGGGWAERNTAHRFAEYADSVGRRLGDRAHAFATLNEPWCSAFLGYASGVQDAAAAVRAVHHLLLGHGEAVTALRLQGKPALLGIALNVYPVEPLHFDGHDAEAVRRIDGLANRIFLDPLLLGDYPVDVVADLSDVTEFDHIRDGDLRVISAPLDLLGENYYAPIVVTSAVTRQTAAGGGRVSPAAGGGRVSPRSPWLGAEDVAVVGHDDPATTPGRQLDPAGLTDVLLRLVADYVCPPLYVTENRAVGHIAVCRDAIDEGVDVRGHFVWLPR